VPDKDYSHRLLIDKLSIKSGMRVAVVGVKDPDFTAQLEARTPDYSMRLRRQCDVILLGVEEVAALQRIGACANSLQPAGGLWIIYPKGRREITQAQVMAAGLAAGLVDNKVCSFSATHTALRFVIRVADRASVYQGAENR
jgi:hypothetical protein